VALGYGSGFDGNDSFGQKGNFTDPGGFVVTHTDDWYSGSRDGYNEFCNKGSNFSSGKW
jgi:hypothetical protein